MHGLAIVGAVSLLALLVAVPPVAAQGRDWPLDRNPQATEEALLLTEGEVNTILATLQQYGFAESGALGKPPGKLAHWRSAIRAFQKHIRRPQTGYLDASILPPLLDPGLLPLDNVAFWNHSGVEAWNYPEVEAPAAAQPPPQIEPPQPQCAAASSSTGCWMKTENKDCYVWNPGPEANETAVWDGTCNGDKKGHGYGILRWKKATSADEEKTEWLTAVGLLEEGLPYGYWNLTYADGGVELEVEYLRGGRIYRTRARDR